MKLAFAFIALATFLTISVAATVNETINECWKGNNHEGLSLCVSQRAASARANLEAVESSMRQAILRSKEPKGYLTPVQKNFEASIKAFLRYRNAQCQLSEALAATGNGATEIKLACEAELDTNRTEQLKAGKWWLK